MSAAQQGHQQATPQKAVESLSVINAAAGAGAEGRPSKTGSLLQLLPNCHLQHHHQHAFSDVSQAEVSGSASPPDHMYFSEQSESGAVVFRISDVNTFQASDSHHHGHDGERGEYFTCDVMMEEETSFSQPCLLSTCQPSR
jgi:hypothetical protein